jgi:hypothetical protein
MAGNKYNVQSAYYSRCISRCHHLRCLANFGARCTSTSQCCGPRAYCNLTAGFPHCKQPSAANRQFINMLSSPSATPISTAFLSTDLGSIQIVSRKAWGLYILCIQDMLLRYCLPIPISAVTKLSSSATLWTQMHAHLWSSILPLADPSADTCSNSNICLNLSDLVFLHSRCLL